MGNLLVTDEQPASGPKYRRWAIIAVFLDHPLRIPDGWVPHNSVKNGEVRCIGLRLFYRAHADGSTPEEAEQLARLRVRKMVRQYEDQLLRTRRSPV